METIRAWVEGFLRGRYGYEGPRAFRMLALAVLVGVILMVGGSLPLRC